MAEDKLVIDVVDNGGQWTHREWRMLRYLGVETQILSNKTPLSDLRKVDGLILSGGAARVGLTGELGNCAEYFQRAKSTLRADIERIYYIYRIYGIVESSVDRCDKCC